MDLIVDEEFRKLKENIGKQVEVRTAEFVEGDFFGPKTFYGRLDEVRDYMFIKIYINKTETATIHRQFAFIGNGLGINLILDENQQVLYQNTQLSFNRPWPDYDIFGNKADNAEINQLRQLKFGEGHDINMK